MTRHTVSLAFIAGIVVFFAVLFTLTAPTSTTTTDTLGGTIPAVEAPAVAIPTVPAV